MACDEEWQLCCVLPQLVIHKEGGEHIFAY
jgi:hypothetical protein